MKITENILAALVIIVIAALMVMYVAETNRYAAECAAAGGNLANEGFACVVKK